MTEAQWLKAKTLALLLRCLYEQFHLNRGQGGRRKLRLFACGLARCVWLMVPDGACIKTVAACEDFADGLIDEKKMTRQWQEFKAEQRTVSCSPWGALDLSRKILRANHWGKNGVLLSAAASETRRVETEWLQEAGADVQVRRDQDADLKRRQIALLRHLVGNPFRPYPAPDDWPSTVVQLARAFRNGEHCGFALHDALLDAGHAELAQHIRDEKEHPRGCWVFDLLLRKA